ncbi:hypothetical protein Aab01nite_03050 [Paractinoplanes abujensis]|uniref:DUF2007 domain-containing protein n=1 Tax=Paractinoplanes abujensis TaxID=882441 RepID=A0A7W7CRC3_9ACTN|nr:DUF2007 domain-containing protein [Actinoplanes abujensis]MBB4691863.1 hypothetical protein [Actinoplanes abujensis]GID16715.1 hypothetical protein Aab01nite_03050 [Actinoplanes abujensis]
MNDIETVTVAVAGSQIEADLIVGLLQSNGLKAIALADDAGGLDPALAVTDGVPVLVNATDEAQARAVLAEAEKNAL